MKIVPVNDENLSVYLTLAQCYEAEFSALTGKRADGKGLFALDTQLCETIKGFLLIIDESPVALAAIAFKENSCYEICEFYVVPSFRNASTGMHFAHRLWKMFPGEWEIKQIAGAQGASEFWRKSIRAFGQGGYEEQSYEDSYWGNVMRQRFRT
jgi:predicted acetyltransferase